MTDHSFAVQVAIVTALKAANIADGRIYDRPGKDVPKPYISIGPSDQTEDDAECIDATVVSQQIDVWSDRQDGFEEAKTIAGAVRAALHRQILPINGVRLVELEVRSVRTVRDPNQVTSHSAIDVRATVETL